MVVIEGLSRRQRIIADTLWNKCRTEADVQTVLAMFGHDARVVYEMIMAATMDQYMETQDAEQILAQFR